MHIVTNEYQDDHNRFCVGFAGISDYIHLEQLIKIISERIIPGSIEKDQQPMGWHTTLIDYSVKKEDIQFLVSLDEFEVIFLTLVSENSSEAVNRLRNWIEEVVISFNDTYK